MMPSARERLARHLNVDIGADGGEFFSGNPRGLAGEGAKICLAQVTLAMPSARVFALIRAKSRPASP